MKRYIFVISLILFLFSNSSVVTATEKKSTPQDNPRIDNRLKNYLKKENINGIILVNKNGQQPKVISNQEPDIAPYYKVEPNKYYPIGSLQKFVTGIMIYNLVQEGKLNWHMPISKFFPKVKKLQGITLWQLLCHQSGIYDKSPLPKKVLITEPDRINFLLKYLKINKKNKWNYASTNYGLLAIIVRKVTGKTYSQCLKELCSSTAISHMKLFNEVNNLNQIVLPAKPESKKTKLILQIITLSYFLLRLRNIDCGNLFSKFCNWDLDRYLSKCYGAGDILATPDDYWTFIYHFLLNNPRIYHSLSREAIHTSMDYFGGIFFNKNYIAAADYMGNYNCGEYTANYKNKRMLMFFANNISYKQSRIIFKKINKIYFTKIKNQQF